MAASWPKSLDTLLRRRRAGRQARRRADRRQIPDPGLRRGRDRAGAAGARRGAGRHRRAAATPRLTTTSARIRRSRSALRVCFGLNARQQQRLVVLTAAATKRWRRCSRTTACIVDPRRQHRLPDGRLVPQGDQDRRRPEGREDAHRRHGGPGHGQARRRAAADRRAATSIRRWRRAPSTPPNGWARTTTRSSASTRSPSSTTTRAGGKAARCSHVLVNEKKWDELPKHYQAALETACAEANVWMPAKYDALNPPALRRLVGERHAAAAVPARGAGGVREGGLRGVRRDRAPRARTSSAIYPDVEEVPRRAVPVVPRRRSAPTTTTRSTRKVGAARQQRRHEESPERRRLGSRRPNSPCRRRRRLLLLLAGAPKSGGAARPLLLLPARNLDLHLGRVDRALLQAAGDQRREGDDDRRP